MKTSTIAMIGGGALALMYFNSRGTANAPANTNQSPYGSNYGNQPAYGPGPGYGGNPPSGYSTNPNKGSYRRSIGPITHLPIRRTGNQYIPGNRDRNAGAVPGSLNKLFKPPSIPGLRITGSGPSSGYYNPSNYYNMAQQYSTPYQSNQNPYIPPQNYQLVPPTAAPYSQPPPPTSGYYAPNTPSSASTAYSPPVIYSAPPQYSPPAPSYSPPPPASGFYGPNTPPSASTAYSVPTTPASYTPMSYVGGPSSSGGSSGGYSGGGGGGYSASGGDCWF